MMREINDMLSGVRTKDKIVKTKGGPFDDGPKEVLVPGKDFKQSYRSLDDLPSEFKNIVKNIKAIGGGSNVKKIKTC